MRQSVNTGPVVPDGFAVALSCAIEASGLTLDRLQHRLAQRGVGVSLSTLSYWRRGRSRPERPQSIKAVRVLEDALALPAGALVSLLGAPRPRGRWLRGPMQRTLELESLWSFDTESAANALSQIEQQPPERLTFMSIHDELNIDAEGKESRIRVRSVVRAEAPGVDRIQITHRADATDLDAPRITAINHGRRGRVHCDGGFLTADILLDRVLQPGETAVIEHEVTSSPGALSVATERRFTRSTPHYLLQVNFHPDAMPARCSTYHRDGPGFDETDEHELWIGASGGVHALSLDVQPGISGIRWKWD